MSDTHPTEDVRAMMRQLRSAPGVDGVSSPHLDDDVIASLVDGVDRDKHREAISHLSGCADCRARLIAVANLLDDNAVAAEVSRLEPPVERSTPRRWSPARWGGAAALAAAAALAIVILRPEKLNVRTDGSVVPSEIRREGTVTTTAPPRILSPAAISADDSLRWSTVPGADLYRVQVWDRDGNVVLSMDTRDTTFALPPALNRVGGSYLWEVKARTGWDRWVSSDFLEFTVRASSGH